MNRITTILIILFLSIDLSGQSVELPLPMACFPFNGDAVDIMTGTGNPANHQSICDRHGNPDGALRLRDCALPVLINCDTDGMTVTFWTNITRSGNSQFIGFFNETGQRIAGFSKLGDMAYLDMYHMVDDGNLSVDRQRLWDTCRFKEDGWHYVCMSFTPDDGTHIHIVTPSGQKAYFYSAFILDPSLIKQARSGNSLSLNDGIDDLKIYSTSFTQSQAETLYDWEKDNYTGIMPIRNISTDRPLYERDYYIHYRGLHDGIAVMSLQASYPASFLKMSENKNIDMLQSSMPGSDIWTMVYRDFRHTLFNIVEPDNQLYLTDRDSEYCSMMNIDDNSQLWT